MHSFSLLAAAQFSPQSLAHPNAWVGHLPFASWLMQTRKPGLFVELGTHTANSYFTFCQAVKEAGLSTQCFAVDTWQGDEHAGNYDDAIFNAVNAYNASHFAAFSTLLRMTFDEALNQFANGSIGLLHIDGLHTYEAVKHDFETWLPKLAPNAIVLFHDTTVRKGDFGVWQLWDELCLQYPLHCHFLHSHGLGVLQLGSDAPNEIGKLSWLGLPPELSERELTSYFEGLGEKQLARFAAQDALVMHEKELTHLQGELLKRDNEISALQKRVGSWSNVPYRLYKKLQRSLGQ